MVLEAMAIGALLSLPSLPLQDVSFWSDIGILFGINLVVINKPFDLFASHFLRRKQFCDQIGTTQQGASYCSCGPGIFLRFRLYLGCKCRPLGFFQVDMTTINLILIHQSKYHSFYRNVLNHCSDGTTKKLKKKN